MLAKPIKNSNQITDLKQNQFFKKNDFLDLLSKPVFKIFQNRFYAFFKTCSIHLKAALKVWQNRFTVESTIALKQPQNIKKLKFPVIVYLQCQNSLL